MSKLLIDTFVHIRRPPATVFAAWSTAEALAKWFAPMAEQPPDVSMEFAVGGCYSIRMPLPDGSVHRTRGEFREIVPDEKIVMTWHCDAFADPESLVEVVFNAVPGGTDLRLVHKRFESPDTCAAHRGGWDACLAALVEFAEKRELP